MIWDKSSIRQRLKELHRAGKDLSYNAMCRGAQSLVSAAAYHFGSYRKAVEAAGFDYAEVTRRPRWNKPRIIQLIKQARRRGEDLHWSAVTARRDELGRAAFASLQPRLFGRWDRALSAAGLDADEISRYRKWDRNSVVFELKARRQGEESLNSGALQRDDPGLHAAAVRCFGSYDDALRAAKVNPNDVRQRRRWTKAEVIEGLKRAAKRVRARPLTGSLLREQSPALYGASVRLFGTFTAARRAAKVDAVAGRRTGPKAGARKRS